MSVQMAMRLSSHARRGLAKNRLRVSTTITAFLPAIVTSGASCPRWHVSEDTLVRCCPNFRILILTGAQPSRLLALREGQARTLALQSKPSRYDFQFGRYRWSYRPTHRSSFVIRFPWGADFRN